MAKVKQILGPRCTIGARLGQLLSHLTAGRPSMLSTDAGAQLPELKSSLPAE